MVKERGFPAICPVLSVDERVNFSGQDFLSPFLIKSPASSAGKSNSQCPTLAPVARIVSVCLRVTACPVTRGLVEQFLSFSCLIHSKHIKSTVRILDPSDPHCFLLTVALPCLCIAGSCTFLSLSLTVFHFSPTLSLPVECLMHQRRLQPLDLRELHA